MSDPARRLYGRLASMVGLARIAATRGLDNLGIRLLQLRFDEAEVRDQTPHMQHYGIASRPKPGADCLVLFLMGDRTRGVVIGSNDRTVQIELAEGEVALHDDLGRKIHLTRDGIIIDGGGSPIKVVGNVDLAGSLRATGDVVAGNVSLKNHTHPGDSGGRTGAPN